MTYETHSPVGPHIHTGIAPELIQYISHNPRDDDRVPTFPTQYPELVRPTNDKMAPPYVPDEFHKLADIDTVNSNRLFINHRPTAGTTFTVSGGGVVDTTLTDRENWIVYFSTLPSTDFTIQYFSEPDKYYGEFLEPIQDLLMKICILLGAGEDTGLMNAQVFVNALPDDLKAKLPNAINFQAVDRDITLASSTDPGAPGGTVHTFTIGNSEDALILDLASFQFYNSGVEGVAGQYGIEDSDRHAFRGRMYMGDTGSYPGALLDDIAGTSNTYNDLVTSRDVLVGGDLTVLGTTTYVNGTTTVDTEESQGDKVVQGDLDVGGSTTLGDSTTDTTEVSGTLTVKGGLDHWGVGVGEARFDRGIEFTDGSLRSTTEIGKIDGLDPSYVQHVRKYSSGDYHRNTVIAGAVNSHYQGSTTSVGTASQLIDTSIGTLYTSNFSTGQYYYDKYKRDPNYYAVIHSGADAGFRVPVADFNPSTKTWTLTRNLPAGAASSGTTFRIYHEGNTAGYLWDSGGTTVGISASTIQPLVCQRDGVIKIRTTSSSVALPSTTAVYYVFMNMTTATGVAEEAEPTFYYSTYPNPSDQGVLIGQASVTSGNITSVHDIQPNHFYDSRWMKFDTAASGHTKLWGSSWAVSGMYQASPMHSAAPPRVQIHLAAHDGVNDGPTYADEYVVSPEDVGVRIKLGLNALSIDTSAAPASYHGLSLPFWLRFITR